MFKNIDELVTQAQDSKRKIYEIMIEQEMEETGVSKEEITENMRRQFQIMKDAVKQGIHGVTSRSGMTGMDAKKLYEFQKRQKDTSDSVFKAAVCYAVATNEVNASMGVVCATPTAGSCGVLPGVLVALQEEYKMSDEEITPYLFTAGAIGYVIANNACIAGSTGGCQAEVGSASAMSAAAAVELAGGTPSQAADAMAIALTNMLGLSCDPVAGLVEVPCITRNAAGASNGLTAAWMAIAGVKSKIPWDEVIEAMYQIGLSMPSALRETAMGGLAATPTGKRWKTAILGKTQGEHTNSETKP